MNRARTVIAAAVAVASLLSSAAPARADGPDVTAPVVSSTGLKDGQLVPQSLNFLPVLNDDVAVNKVQLILDGQVVNTYVVKPSWNGRLQLIPYRGSVVKRSVCLTVRDGVAEDSCGEGRLVRTLRASF